MTREEAIHILDNLKPTNTKSSFDAYVVGKAITMAIKALEQNESAEEWYKLFVEKLEQEPKTGHWIEHDWEDMRKKGYYRCSVCGTGYQRFVKGIRKSDVPYIDGQEYTLQNIDNYCPNCGCRMIEPQESEDKE